MSDNFVVCNKCGAINRLPSTRSGIDAKCGKCRLKLFVGHSEDVNAEAFERQIARSTISWLSSMSGLRGADLVSA